MIQPHQQRVIDEKAELDGRIAKLAAFVESPVLLSVRHDEQERLKDQLDVMRIFPRSWPPESGRSKPRNSAQTKDCISPTKGRTDYPRLTGGTRTCAPTPGIEHTAMTGDTRGKAAATARMGNPFFLF